MWLCSILTHMEPRPPFRKYVFMLSVGICEAMPTYCDCILLSMGIYESYPLLELLPVAIGNDLQQRHHAFPKELMVLCTSAMVITGPDFEWSYLAKSIFLLHGLIQFSFHCYIGSVLTNHGIMQPVCLQLHRYGNNFCSMTKTRYEIFFGITLNLCLNSSQPI